MKSFFRFCKFFSQAIIAISMMLKATSILALNSHIHTDNTLSGIGAQTITGVNHVYTLSEIHGKTVGSNLFYSFSDFNIGAADTAWFDLHSPDLANVISRVTGGVESFVDGQLKMTNVGSTPSFFFINPAGITFGAGASIDVPGSFYVSTASGLNMNDGSVYAANEPQTSTLSAASPESFGFLGDESGSINISGLEEDLAELTFKPGTDVVFVGNDIHIENAILTNTDSSQAGLKMAYVAIGNEAIDISLTTLPDQVTYGEISIHNAKLESDGSSGNIIISSQEVEINNGLVSNRVSGVSGQAGNITVNTGIFNINNGIIRSDTISTAQAGSININANQLVINSQGKISAETIGKGNAGNIFMAVDTLEINEEIITTLTNAEGNAGDITIKAELLTLDINGGIGSDSDFDATGHGGNVFITAPQIQLKGSISSNSLGKGDAGNIFITTDAMKISDIGIISTGTYEISEDLRLTAHGAGGDITVNAKTVEIVEEGFISSNTASTGDAGNIFVNADHVLFKDNGTIQAAVIGENVRGNGGDIIVNTKVLEFKDGFISGKTQSDGNAGNIEINTYILKLTETGGIQTGSGSNSNDKATGDGGSISINAEIVEIENSFIVNETYGSGDAGQITINANSVQLYENGFISATTFGSGRSGDIHITANKLLSKGTGLIDIDLRSMELSGVFSGADSGSSGQLGSINIDAGNRGQLDIQLENSAYISIQNEAEVVNKNASTIPVIDINATNLTLTNSFITTESSGNVDAGDIDIHFTGQLFLDPSHISTEANVGNGGDITITGGELVYLQDSAITTSVKGQTGDGGDIDISADNLIMDSGFIRANTNATGASGGDVNIKVVTLVPSGSFLQTGGSTAFEFQPFSGINVIQAVAPDGVNGAINAETPQLNLSGVLTNLVIESFDSSTLNHNMCAIEDGSSLHQSGKGGMRMRARDFLLLPVY